MYVIYRADHASDSVRKLTNMITHWINSDLSASWESLADALSDTPGYGPATADRLRRTVQLPGKECTFALTRLCSYTV